MRTGTRPPLFIGKHQPFFVTLSAMVFDSFFFALMGLGTQEILLIVLAVLILFGARKIPEFARGLGQGIREFKNATNNVKNEIQKEIDRAPEAAHKAEPPAKPS
jgi:sec-independent protein translocase protein TatA